MMFAGKSMQLTAADLREIADAMDSLDKLDIEVRVAKVAGHHVVMEKKDFGTGQRGAEKDYKRIVVGLTTKNLSGELGELTR